MSESTDLPHRRMIIHFERDAARAGIAIMARLFDEGWETLVPLQYSACGHYYTELYFPQDSAVTKF